MELAGFNLVSHGWAESMSKGDSLAVLKYDFFCQLRALCLDHEPAQNERHICFYTDEPLTLRVRAAIGHQGYL